MIWKRGVKQPDYQPLKEIEHCFVSQACTEELGNLPRGVPKVRSPAEPSVWGNIP